MQHQELLEKLNSLNVLRESNATLRDTSDRHVQRAKRLEAEVLQLQAQLNPLQARVRALEAEVEANGREVKILETDNARWKERMQEVLQKQNRIDPAEFEALKEERAVLLEQVSSLQGNVETLMAAGKAGADLLGDAEARAAEFAAQVGPSHRPLA